MYFFYVLIYFAKGNSAGTFYYRVKGYNSEHEWGDFCTLEDMEVELLINDPPETPTIEGLASGTVGEEYEYTFKTTDPDGNQVYYYIEWGDGDIVEWDGPHDSGVEVTLSHTWDETGTYVIKAKAKDIWDYESQWETLTVTMPRGRLLPNTFFMRFLERFPNAFPLLRHILGL